MVGYRQVTRECEQMLDRIKHAYLLHPLPEVETYIREQCDTVVDLSDEYESGRDRSKSYNIMADKVLTRAETTDAPVGLIVYGHPTVGVTPTGLISDRAPDEGLSVSVLPSVSSLDCLYTDLGINPLDRGLQIFEATDLLVYNTQLNTSIPTLIMQIGLVGTRLYDDNENKPERFTPVREYLTQFYPPDHRIHIVRTATMPLASPERITIQLDEIESVADRIDDTHTLYVPPARNRVINDEQFASKIRSKEYLNRISKK